MSDFASPVNVPRNTGERAIYGRDEGLYVEFTREPVFMEFKSQEAGRPIYEERDFVYIVQPGNKSDLKRPVRLNNDNGNVPDNERFPKQWARFQNSVEQVQDGLPLEQCPFLNKSRVMELKSLRIHTVEQLAMVSDAVTQTMGMDGRKLRDTARAFLDDATRLADNAAKDAKINTLQAELDAMKQQIADLASLRSEREAA